MRERAGKRETEGESGEERELGRERGRERMREKSASHALMIVVCLLSDTLIFSYSLSVALTR